MAASMPIVPLAPVRFSTSTCCPIVSDMRSPRDRAMKSIAPPGAGGTIGMDAAMKSAPDGYTVLITNDNAASAPHIMKLSYDYTKELIPVCFLGRHGQILAAHSSIGVSTLKELVEYA